MIEIDKNEPMPEKRVVSSTAYPFDAMEPGNSFLAGEYTREAMQKMGAYIGMYEKKHEGKKFSARKTEDNQIRVWRVS